MDGIGTGVFAQYCNTTSGSLQKLLHTISNPQYKSSSTACSSLVLDMIEDWGMRWYVDARLQWINPSDIPSETFCATSGSNSTLQTFQSCQFDILDKAFLLGEGSSVRCGSEKLGTEWCVRIEAIHGSRCTVISLYCRQGPSPPKKGVTPFPGFCFFLLF